MVATTYVAEPMDPLAPSGRWHVVRFRSQAGSPAERKVVCGPPLYPKLNETTAKRLARWYNWKNARDRKP